MRLGCTQGETGGSRATPPCTRRGAGVDVRAMGAASSAFDMEMEEATGVGAHRETQPRAVGEGELDAATCIGGRWRVGGKIGRTGEQE